MKPISLGLWLVFVSAVLSPQVPEEEVKTRSLWDTTFLNKRPPMKKSPSIPSKTADAARPALHEDSALIRLTVWGLRESRPEDEEGVRMFVHDDGGGKEWTPERVGVDGLEWGQRVRFSIEADREGFLYIVDRERFANGA